MRSAFSFCLASKNLNNKSNRRFWNVHCENLVRATQRIQKLSPKSWVPSGLTFIVKRLHYTNNPLWYRYQDYVPTRSPVWHIVCAKLDPHTNPPTIPHLPAAVLSPPSPPSLSSRPPGPAQTLSLSLSAESLQTPGRPVGSRGNQARVKQTFCRGLIDGTDKTWRDCGLSEFEMDERSCGDATTVVARCVLGNTYTYVIFITWGTFVGSTVTLKILQIFGLHFHKVHINLFLFNSPISLSLSIKSDTLLYLPTYLCIGLA